jgi:osmotically-inducible protein OsmY
LEWTKWQSAEQGHSLEDALLEDALLTEQAVQHRLCHHYNRQVRALACEVRDGMVILRGYVTEYYYKQLAQEAVRHVAGTCRIHNCVEVLSNP